MPELGVRFRGDRTDTLSFHFRLEMSQFVPRTERSGVMSDATMLWTSCHARGYERNGAFSEGGERVERVTVGLPGRTKRC
jgi:hypothetical protein